MESVSFAASIVSIALGLIAIAISLYFYTQGKNTEQRVTNALEAIKAQTDTMQRLSARQMDRLIKGVIEPDSSQSTIVFAALDLLRAIPENVASQLQTALRALHGRSMQPDAVVGYIGAYYYCAMANVVLQGYLPAFTELQSDNTARPLVDQTFNDCNLLEGVLNEFQPQALQASSVFHLYQEARNRWKPLVKDSLTVYQQRGTTQT